MMGYLGDIYLFNSLLFKSMYLIPFKLIGVNLCRRIDGMKLIGKIIETEAYLG